ncbi:hypothetical protein G6F46_005553 [Rhizopus delemar]|uniref:CCHC-type domain-containing protein n=2 Tax=Rhizopus TaxID=4842 RepID=A0A9P6YW00_9FUNG|nr:hypothetical protein G6F55_009007 [Rhizopus delemar]KAG1537972.1 hypothetical protein G6F51_010048 [Rhizopus arrhizus]KAG1492139.1 hypothetical protein G6F54_009522 [Rhizopus delemar]KAG1506396.1 hypothetical protein G6F53_009720 [Rhizopus delemar]KAG1521241.1 hypothetical protein G6F52_006925 [Rhizopus delemar]
MTLSAKINLVPNKATDSANSNFLQTKRLWTQLLVGSTRISSYGAQSNSQSVPPPTSVFSDVSTSHPSPPSSIKSSASELIVQFLKNKEQFFQDLKKACNENEHLLSFEDKVKHFRQKIFAEVLLSPTMPYRLSPLSPDADSLQNSFSNLPHEYGRKDGDLDQLHADMITNLAPYSIVLERPSRPSSQSTDAPGAAGVRPLPPHKLDWIYPSVNNNESSDIDLDTTLDKILLSAIVCYNCNAHSHKSRSCPRKNAALSSDVPNKKARKTPNSVPISPPPVILQETLAPPRASVDKTTPEENFLASESALDLVSNSPDAPSSDPKTSRTPPIRSTWSQTASKSAELPATDVTPTNAPPRLIGHLRTNHNDCLKNPRRQTQPATTSVQLVEVEDQFEPMREDDLETVNPSCDAPIESTELSSQHGPGCTNLQ